MSRHVLPPGLVIALVLCLLRTASADITDVVRCQNKIAHAGATFAKRSVKLTLKCFTALANCQIQCEQGVFGPPCEEPPEPGCCDPDDPNSNSAYSNCLDDAEETCDEQTARIADQEIRKQVKIIAACEDLTPEELCGAQATGLNFETLNAGCLALDPNYECNLEGMVACVGGPLERLLTDQIAGLLVPRAQEGIGLLMLEESFPGIPVAHKVKDQLEVGKADVWAISGQAGDLISARVKPKDDDNDGFAALDAALTLVGMDGTTALGNTIVYGVQCAVPTTCASTCAQLERRLPYSGTFFLVVEALATPGCDGGPYKLIVSSPGGVAIPTLQLDDIDPPVSPP
ncbi:MAG: hypothetical protein O7B23_05885 [Deltaproteobacteria bacterium]|nr:hypothetical protein [Deltaproteobacteria bacterium]